MLLFLSERKNMKLIKIIKSYFTRTELILGLSSLLLITASFLIFDRGNLITLIASLTGAVSILFNSKGNPFGQILMIVFSLIYGYISFSFRYYGEMMTYLGMTMPMAVMALISWLKHPYKDNRSEVEVGHVGRSELGFMFLLAIAVTVIFYFLLDHFETANLYPSTLSVTTSFIAVYLTFRRSPYFSIAYALNDIVLIVLWSLAGFEDTKYISVAVCFIAFLFNDCYCFISWKAMGKRQKQSSGSL